MHKENKEFGIFMTEMLELAMRVHGELEAAGELLPETSDENIQHNTIKLILAMKQFQANQAEGSGATL